MGNSSTNKKAKNDITFSEAKEYFDYVDGELVWRKQASTKRPGDVVRRKGNAGYVIVGFKKRHYLAHRVIWLWHYGYFPEGMVDHIDRDIRNNRIENLREVSNQCNVRNSSVHKSNTSNVKGVSWSKAANKWHAYIENNGKREYLGIFEDFTEAVKARWEREVEGGWPGCDSNSSAYRFLIESRAICEIEVK